MGNRVDVLDADGGGKFRCPTRVPRRFTGRPAFRLTHAAVLVAFGVMPRLPLLLPVLALLVCPAASARDAGGPPPLPARPPYDLVIRNGRVMDGSGRPAFAADVAIKDGRIAAVGRVPAGQGASEIDATNSAVAPGFIDVHPHVDADVHKSPAAENFVRDGVTTVVTGNCGGSVGDVGDYLARVGKRGAGVNVATLYGHNTVLRAVKGDRKGELTPPQMETARGLVRAAMRDGAVGFSTGLIYNPGQFSPTEEIIELAKVAGAFGGVYATHMRSENAGVVAAIDEALRVGREANVRLQISHFKLPAQTARKLGGSDVTVKRVTDARAAGADVWLDQYPYTASSTTISTLLPSEFLEAGVDAARARLTDPAQYEATLRAMVRHHGETLGRTSMAYAVVASSAAFPKFNGMNVEQIARAMRADAARGNETELLKDAAGPAVEPNDVSLEAQCRAILDVFGAGNAQCVFHTMEDAEVEAIMRSPLVAVASDSGLREFGVGVPHPRGYGTNARVLGRYAREKKLFAVEEAVRKMTSQPAATFRLADRGLLEPGRVADVVVFDPETVVDRSTFEKPHQYPAGIPHVIVNGVPVLRDGKLTGDLPGRPVFGPGVRTANE